MSQEKTAQRMELWIQWWGVMWELRPACSRLQTFLWFAAAVAGLTIRTDLLGVTSIVRALGLEGKYYDNLLDAFHSAGISLPKMTTCWVHTVLRVFAPVMANGRLVLVGDGIKIPKRGKKMPGVKLLHQESDVNTKPEYIMGHSFQAVALLAKAAQGVLAVPLASRIHEGLIFSNRDKRSLLDKMILLLSSLDISRSYYFVADAYYASQKIIAPLLRQGNHLVTRVRLNAVAYRQVAQPTERRTRGRPRKYGEKVKVRSLLLDVDKMESAPSPVYDDDDVAIQYRSLDLLWRPVGVVVRFVAVCHPSRGKCVLMTTDLSLEPLEIIRLYGLRFKIEFSFKQAVRLVGAYAYHFWMMAMKPLRRRNGNQHLHRETEDYRNAVRRKLHAYHVFVHAGIVAQGLLQYLAANFPSLVWSSFGSWLRTIRDGVPPSELVTAAALRNTFPEFLVDWQKAPILAKFILERSDPLRSKALSLAA